MAAEGAHHSEAGLAFAAGQIGFGPLAGLLVAVPASYVVQRAATAHSINSVYEHFSGLAIAIGAFGVAELIGGNGFIAAFTAGLVVGNMTSTVRESLQEFAEEEGQLLALMAFLVFGATMLPEAIAAVDTQMIIYAVLSLTVVRMLPVAIALFGSGLQLPSVAFLGWFGPRGLATILFALMVSEAEAIPHHEHMVHIITLVVAASTLAHGLTAAPLARIYGKWIDNLRTCTPEGPECGPTAELPVRIRSRQGKDRGGATP